MFLEQVSAPKCHCELKSPLWLNTFGNLLFCSKVLLLITTCDVGKYDTRTSNILITWRKILGTFHKHKIFKFLTCWLSLILIEGSGRKRTHGGPEDDYMSESYTILQSMLKRVAKKKGTGHNMRFFLYSKMWIQIISSKLPTFLQLRLLSCVFKKTCCLIKDSFNQ